ncbi:SpoIIE family protein phosphatase [Candidatus Albibeggiatoa sp. nov. NOAA]|uniref:SpoIIE family protein phosphatase n=1 Tax=Candidatus Albibeggiatoa sp. nov. NOAA TaxID=3162724 RepID=UPI0032F7A749|nr:SpoIIE family protein phosphatase [Thiotrichaceae bacterium]
MLMQLISSFIARLLSIRLRTMLIVPFIIQVILVVGLTGYLALQNNQRLISDMVTHLRQELSEKIQGHLQLYLQIPLQVTQTVVNQIELGAGKITEPRTLQNLLYKNMQDAFNSNYIGIGNEEGEFIGCGNLNGRQFNLSLEISDEQTHYAMESYQLGAFGQIIEQQGVTPNYDPRNRPWYIPVKQTNKPHWSDVFVTFTNPQLVITIGTPIFNAQQQFMGTVGSDMSLWEISQFLQSLDIGKAGQAFIMERQTGLMVATSTGEKAFQREHHSLKRLAALDSHSHLTAQTAQYLQQKFQSFSNITQTVLLDFYIENQRHFLSVIPFQDNMGLDWLITIVIPETDFTAHVDKNTQMTLFLILIALMIVVFIGLLTTHWVVTPIKRLNCAAQTLAKGHWEHKACTANHNHHEIGELAQAFDGMASQLKAVFDSLETKVDERTQDLKQAQEEIQALNEYLQQEHTRMSTELDITRQLQKMVLPRRKELADIQDLDIPVYMQPATEVGGDYYDVIEYGNTVKVAIGDVTGHGLTSGVLMLMVQSAVRTLFMNNMCKPEACLNIVNRTIYNNVQRMQVDKNLSLILLSYQYGQVEFVGQHEEVVVVRRDGTVERFDTIDLGFPVGLEENIEAFVHRAELYLDQGDGIVLYTDGITEAENQHKQLYGNQRLCKILSENWTLPAKQIQEHVIQDVKQHIGQHKVYDDLTLLVIKRYI